MPLDATQTVAALALAAHPEGGWYRELFRSPRRITRADGAERSALTLIWFLLAPGQVSAWHRVRGADETWHWVDGGALELLVVERDGRAWRTVLGARDAGHASSAIVPADAWQAARPLGDEAALVQCAVAPGFDFADLDLWRDVPDAHAALATAPEDWNSLMLR
jgi:hypothetical protein